jgi:hypothetical protein
MIETVLNTAHIHLDHAVFRIHVQDSRNYPIEEMNESPDKPDFLLYVSYSADPEQTKQSIIAAVVDGYDLNELADWVRKFEKH